MWSQKQTHTDKFIWLLTKDTTKVWRKTPFHIRMGFTHEITLIFMHFNFIWYQKKTIQSIFWKEIYLHELSVGKKSTNYKWKYSEPCNTNFKNTSSSEYTISRVKGKPSTRRKCFKYNIPNKWFISEMRGVKFWD